MRTVSQTCLVSKLNSALSISTPIPFSAPVSSAVNEPSTASGAASLKPANRYGRESGTQRNDRCDGVAPHCVHRGLAECQTDAAGIGEQGAPDLRRGRQGNGKMTAALQRLDQHKRRRNADQGQRDRYESS